MYIVINGVRSSFSFWRSRPQHVRIRFILTSFSKLKIYDFSMQLLRNHCNKANVNIDCLADAFLSLHSRIWKRERLRVRFAAKLRSRRVGRATWCPFTLQVPGCNEVSERTQISRNSPLDRSVAPRRPFHPSTLNQSPYHWFLISPSSTPSRTMR